jgi:hypothetical protein
VVTRIENAIQYKDIGLGAFLDIEGGFDRTSFDTIIQAAGRHGIESPICRCICATLETEIYVLHRNLRFEMANYQVSISTVDKKLISKKQRDTAK